MIELHPGDELDLVTADGTPLTRLQLGLGWDKERTAGFIGTGAPDIDLDASAVQFAGGQLFDLAFYNHLATRDGSVVHLGDNKTGSGAGDDEAITVDLSKVHGPVDQIVFVVSSYQGHTLEWVNNAYCRLIAGDQPEGEGEEPVELARLTLTGGVPETGVVMAKLVRAGDRWRLRAIGSGVRLTKPSDAGAALARFL
ncbi:TerD family protein [Nocardioides sp.]|uniref:TerD family protein n=1 Tax=Nocardioides sp. TaxID=35761 RepID=UPI002EDA0809